MAETLDIRQVIALSEPKIYSTAQVAEAIGITKDALGQWVHRYFGFLPSMQHTGASRLYSYDAAMCLFRIAELSRLGIEVVRAIEYLSIPNGPVEIRVGHCRVALDAPEMEHELSMRLYRAQRDREAA